MKQIKVLDKVKSQTSQEMVKQAKIVNCRSLTIKNISIFNINRVPQSVTHLRGGSRTFKRMLPTFSNYFINLKSTLNIVKE